MDLLANKSLDRKNKRGYNALTFDAAHEGQEWILQRAGIWKKWDEYFQAPRLDLCRCGAYAVWSMRFCCTGSIAEPSVPLG